MSKIIVHKLNEVFFKLDINIEQSLELKEYFSEYAPNFWFSPKYYKRGGSWDGRISYFNRNDQTLPIGLYRKFIQFCKDFKYEYEILINQSDFYNDITDDEFLHFYKSIFKDTKFYPRDYQDESIKKALKLKRGVIQSPTASGKSLIIYSLIRFILGIEKDAKILLIVPTIGLVNQMDSDFNDYGFPNAKSLMSLLYGTSDRYDESKPILVSTWQSLYKRPISYFKNFKAVIIDECHGAKAASLKEILEKCVNTDYRIGLTGTLPKEKTDKLTIQGYLGPTIFLLKTTTLIEKGILSSIKIVTLLLKYPEYMIEQLKEAKDYDFEINQIISYSKRNKVLKYIIDHQDTQDNYLVLCYKIEHLKQIKEYLDAEYLSKGYSIYEIYGETNAIEREKIRKLMNTQGKTILVATFGTVSTGFNVPRLNHIILASSNSSEIRTLQSIGRGLRKHENKKKLIVWDIVDDFSFQNRLGNLGKNYSYKQYEKRLEYYKEQKFDVVKHKIDLQKL